ncbi:MAG: ABC transporter permease [Chloroflexota bacterium]|nr:ABC transporter permease [Chloroflexota bacterium]
MATLAERGIAPGREAWEYPRERPLLARLGRLAAKNPVGAVALLIVVAFFVLGVIGPYVAPYDPQAFDRYARLQGPSAAHWFGTNSKGQDIFSRVLVGARVSMTFGLVIMFFGFIPGAVLGIISGYAGRWLDYLIQRSSEAWTAFPQLVLVLTFLSAFGPGLRNVSIVIAIGALFGGSRLLRALAIVEKHKEYVAAARSTGATEFRVLWRHVVPNIMPYILVGISSVFAVAVLAEAVLSYLGLGLSPGTPGWGIDLASSLGSAQHYPYLVIFYGGAISIVVLGFNLLGDTLRDILDPRLRGSR